MPPHPGIELQSRSLQRKSQAAPTKDSCTGTRDIPRQISERKRAVGTGVACNITIGARARRGLLCRPSPKGAPGCNLTTVPPRRTPHAHHVHTEFRFHFTLIVPCILPHTGSGFWKMHTAVRAIRCSEGSRQKLNDDHKNYSGRYQGNESRYESRSSWSSAQVKN